MSHVNPIPPHVTNHAAVAAAPPWSPVVRAANTERIMVYIKVAICTVLIAILALLAKDQVVALLALSAVEPDGSTVATDPPPTLSEVRAAAPILNADSPPIAFAERWWTCPRSGGDCWAVQSMDEQRKITYTFADVDSIDPTHIIWELQ